MANFAILVFSAWSPFIVPPDHEGIIGPVRVEIVESMDSMGPERESKAKASRLVSLNPKQLEVQRRIQRQMQRGPETDGGAGARFTTQQLDRIRQFPLKLQRDNK